MSRWAPTLGMVALTALIAAACGGGTADTTETASAPEPAEATPSPATDSEAADPGSAAPDDEANAAADEDPATDGSGDTPEPVVPIETDVPDIDVIDVATGDTVNLRSFVPSATPLLFWFYAPH